MVNNWWFVMFVMEFIVETIIISVMDSIVFSAESSTFVVCYVNIVGYLKCTYKYLKGTKLYHLRRYHPVTEFTWKPRSFHILTGSLIHVKVSVKVVVSVQILAIYSKLLIYSFWIAPWNLGPRCWDAHWLLYL